MQQDSGNVKDYEADLDQILQWACKQVEKDIDRLISEPDPELTEEQKVRADKIFYGVLAEASNY